jgi:hypothetical protein
MINEVTYCLVAHTLVIQFNDNFMEHLSFHQFGVVTHGGCEIMVYNI